MNNEWQSIFKVTILSQIDSQAPYIAYTVNQLSLIAHMKMLSILVQLFAIDNFTLFYSYSLYRQSLWNIYICLKVNLQHL